MVERDHNLECERYKAARLYSLRSALAPGLPGTQAGTQAGTEAGTQAGTALGHVLGAPFSPEHQEE